MAHRYRPKICITCGEEFKPRSGTHRFCDACGAEVRRACHRECNRRWEAKQEPDELRARNREKARRCRKRQKEKDPDLVKLRNKEQHERQKERDPEKLRKQNRLRNKVYRIRNPEKRKQSTKLYRDTHKEERLEYQRQLRRRHRLSSDDFQGRAVSPREKPIAKR
jgi:hypothetical protein